MQNQRDLFEVRPERRPWNKGKLIGAKPPPRPKHVWSIRIKLQVEGRNRDLALFNLAIDSKLRGCDVVSVRVDDVAARALTADRAMVRQKKPEKIRQIKGLTEKQVALMQRESANVDRQFKLIEKSNGTDHLDLVLVNGYIAKLLANAKVVRFLAQHYADILVEFQKLVEAKSATA